MSICTHNRLCRIGLWLLLWTGLMTINSVSTAAPPHPDLLEKIKDGRTSTPYFLKNIQEMRGKGIDTPDRDNGRTTVRFGTGSAASTAITGSYRLLALLVDFSDNNAAIASAILDTMLFDSLGNSVRNYYGEVSYGQVDLITVNLPSSTGWQRAPQLYSYYVNNSNGTGSYPQNSQKLVEDLVDLADPLVDFSAYDNDNDGYVDALLVIHAGSGAESSGQNTDIWSHKWAITPRSKDGVNITTYAILPEYWNTPGDLTIGVYVHELGHAVFNLPDLYDIDNSSYGIGRWGLMGYGSWLGPSSDGSSPAHPSAWSRIAMGYATPIDVTGNINGQVIAPVERSGEIYHLWNAGGTSGSSKEYFLIENRQRLGYDSYLMGEGILIWHVDDDKPDNTQEWWQGLDGTTAHYRVGLVPADGAFEIAQKIDQGDAADPFPGSGSKTSFSSQTLPNSDTYAGANTTVAITGIAVSGDSIAANLIVGLSADIGNGGSEALKPSSIKLHQNYPNPFNPQTTLSFSTDYGGRATVEVFNTLGRKVRTVLDTDLPPGTHSVIWDTRDQSGNQVASGVYLYRLQIETEISSKKMILIR